MRTKVDLPEDLLAEAQRASGAKTKPEAIMRALRVVIREQLREELLAMRGSDAVDMTPEELERWRESEH